MVGAAIARDLESVTAIVITNKADPTAALFVKQKAIDVAKRFQRIGSSAGMNYQLISGHRGVQGIRLRLLSAGQTPAFVFSPLLHR